MEQPFISPELAPLEGVTTWLFRRTQAAYFGKPIRSYTPFISPTQNHCFTGRELSEILPEQNDGLNVVPQLIGHNAADFLWAAGELKSMGYDEVNLNLGCPSGTVTRKKKGAGLLGDLPMLADFLDRIFESSPLRISVKTRVGRKGIEETQAIAELFAAYPISSLIVHPRFEKDLYTGPVSPDAFRIFQSTCRCPIVYNGDLFNALSVRTFCKENPDVNSVMCGRGFVANPKLAQELRGAPSLCREELKAFHDEFFARNAARIKYDKPLLLHMKEYWTYWGCCFTDANKQLKQLFKAQNINEYKNAVSLLFLTSGWSERPGYVRKI